MSELTFAELDSEAIESSIITGYEKAAGKTLMPGDPVRLFLETLAYYITLQNSIIDLAGKQNLLAYATGGHLDAIAALVGAERLPASKARCQQEFTLEDSLNFDVVIPAGAQVASADGSLLFSTVSELTIAAGERSGSVIVEAAQAGSACNGLVPGQISVLVTPIAYVKATNNLTATISGSEVESDEHFRARAQLAPEEFTCAGPVAAYRSQTLKAHQDISEVSIWSPRAGVVDVRPILAGGELPGEEVLEAVRSALNADDVRPLTDTVIVAAPECVEYEIDVSWSLLKSKEAMAVTIMAAVNAAVEEYRLWQRSLPGRDIDPTKLVSLMEQAGAYNVYVTSPQHAGLAAKEIARETSVNVTYLGVSED